MTHSPDESRTARGSFRWWAFAALSVVGMSIVTVYLLVPIDFGTRTPGLRTICTNNMRSVGGALLVYPDSHQGKLPPAFVADINGKPINSWRVMLFRQLDRPELAATYDLTGPWDGPKNQKLATGSLDDLLFHCPSSSERPTGKTNYLVVTGPGTLFPGGKQVSLKDVKDGLDNTILLVEVADSDIFWTEPRDLTLDEALQGINASIHGKAGKGRSISSYHPGGAYVMFADGRLRFLPEDISPALLKALLTIDGGEDLRALGWK